MTLEINQKMDELKKQINKITDNNYFVEYDGSNMGDIDTRLHLQFFPADTLTLDKKQYKKFERILNNTRLKTANYEIYFWCDISGYEYWNKEQEENNYIQGTILIKNVDKLFKSEKFKERLIKDIYKISEKLDNKLYNIGLYYSCDGN